MNERYVCDMTKGNEVGLLLRFALPMLVGNIFQQLYNMVDSIIVGKFVGSNALGAVGAVGNLNFLFFSLCLGLASGIGILISQFFGAGKDDYVKKIIANSVYIITISGAVMSIISFVFARPILHLMNTPAENMEDAVIYMQIVCGATVIVAIYNGISSILRALGDSKTPLIFLIVSSFINVGLDLLFVLVFHWGVAGAAWATVIAQLISAIGSILFALSRNPYLRLEKRHFTVDNDIIKKSFQIGLPVAGQNAMIAFSCVALQSVVNNYGATVMAAYTATSRVEQLVQQPFGSLGTAVSTFAGQNVGAGKYDRVSTSCKKSTLVVLVFSLMMIAVMFLFGDPIVRLFVNEPDVIEIGARGLRITSFMYFALGMIYITRGMLNGVGDAAYAMINGLTEVVGRIGFAYLLMAIPAVGMWGVWYTNGLTWILAGAAGIIRFFQGKWKTKSVVKDVAF
ncbi:MAG: MATE family efflux transporter [Clostridiales bacterium]|nr:MATE family efflux transporter [Clostridiales bacterium]